MRLACHLCAAGSCHLFDILIQLSILSELGALLITDVEAAILQFVQGGGMLLLRLANHEVLYVVSQLLSVMMRLRKYGLLLTTASFVLSLFSWQIVACLLWLE